MGNKSSLTKLGSVSLLKVDRNKSSKEKIVKSAPSIATSMITPTSRINQADRWASNKLNHRKKTATNAVHVEFAPTTPMSNANAKQLSSSHAIKHSIIAPNHHHQPMAPSLTNILPPLERKKSSTLITRIMQQQSMIGPSAQPPLSGAIDEHGFIYDKELADKKTREILDRSRQQDNALSGAGGDATHFMDVDGGGGNASLRRKQERCQCPNCMDPNRDPNERRAATLHSCHYADCGKKYKKTSHLRAHLRWHVGDQPFMCSWKNCGKRY